MRNKIFTFVTILACAMLIMKLNINATTECASTGTTGSTPPSVKWIKVDYNAAVFVLPAYQQGINSCIISALSNDVWKNFTRILPYNNPLCLPCSPPSARYGYIQLNISATGYSSTHTIKLDYGNPANSVITYSQSTGTSIAGNHLRFQANGGIDIVVPSSISYTFTGIIKSPCGMSGGCDYQNPDNIYVFKNEYVVTNTSVSSIPFDLKSILTTYTSSYINCSINY